MSKITGRAECGDSFLIMPGIKAKSFDLILTDPPYAINYRSNRRVARPKFDHITGDQPGNWIDVFAKHAYRLLKPDRHLYCFCRHDLYPTFFTAFAAAGFSMKRTLIWIKNNHGSGDLNGDYAPQDEWIIFAHKGYRKLNKPRASNILYFDKVSSKHLRHPTEKPGALLRFLIEKSTSAGETIFDPFAGVISTGVAAMSTGRGFRAIEIDGEYYNVGCGDLMQHDSRRDYSLTLTPRLARGR